MNFNNYFLDLILFLVWKLINLNFNRNILILNLYYIYKYSKIFTDIYEVHFY